MSVTAATSTSPTPAATDSTALGRASLVTNFNTFLALLTTQLKKRQPARHLLKFKRSTEKLPREVYVLSGKPRPT